MKTNKTSRTQGTPQQFLSAIKDKIIELGGSNEPSEVLSSSTTDKLKRGVALKRGTPDQFKMELTAKIAELGGDVAACDSITSATDTEYETDFRFYCYESEDKIASHEPFEYFEDAINFANEHNLSIVKRHNYYRDEDGGLNPDGDPIIWWIDGEVTEDAQQTYQSHVDDFISSAEDIDPGKIERYIHNLMGSISDLLEEEGYNVGFDDNGESLVISIYPVGEERCDGEYTFPKSALQVANGSDTYTDASNIVEILMGRGHFEDFYASTEIVASDELLYDDYDFDVDGDEYDWSEEWVEVKSKSVPDSDGFMTDYTMYRNRADGSFIFMFGDKEINTPSADYADWSAETEKEADEWFANYNGFADEDEDVDDVQLFDEIPEVQNFKQAVNDADTVDDIELLIQGLSDGVAEDYVTSDLNSALNETDDIGQIKYAVVNSISIYVEENGWEGSEDIIESGTELNYGALDENEIIEWLGEHEQAWEDFTAHFSEYDINQLSDNEIIGWIYEHDSLFEDFCAKFPDIATAWLD